MSSVTILYIELNFVSALNSSSKWTVQQFNNPSVKSTNLYLIKRANREYTQRDVWSNSPQERPCHLLETLGWTYPRGWSQTGSTDGIYTTPWCCILCSAQPSWRIRASRNRERERGGLVESCSVLLVFWAGLHRQRGAIPTCRCIPLMAAFRRTDPFLVYKSLQHNV